MNMSTVERSVYSWNSFWDYLEELESPWARQLSEEQRRNFEVTIVSMVRASVPTEQLAILKQLWSSLHLNTPVPSEWWNLQCTLDSGGGRSYETAEKDVKDVLNELWNSQEGIREWQNPVYPQDLMDAARSLIKELKYTALCSVWNFVGSWACFTAGLPREVLNGLRDELFGLAMIELLQQLVEG